MAEQAHNACKVWEQVDERGYTYRLRVPYGWIYRYSRDYFRSEGHCMVFVPNPDTEA